MATRRNVLKGLGAAPTLALFGPSLLTETAEAGVTSEGTWKITGSHVVVRRGLKDGDLVIVNPPPAPTEGLLVSPVLGQTDSAEEPVALTREGRPDDRRDVQR